MTNQIEIKNGEYCQETLELFTKMQIGYLALAARLHKIKNERLYQPTWDSFQSYCMEMSEMSISTVSRLVNLQQKLVLDSGIPESDISEAGWSKVAMALPIIHTADEAKFWVEKAKVLSKTDFSRELKEFKTGRQMKDCEHLESYLVRYCPDCKDKWREYDVATINDERVKAALDRAGIAFKDEQVVSFLKELSELAYAAEKSIQSGD